ncbi:unnamed protein product, partial [Mesorhabditis spiculigera]
MPDNWTESKQPRFPIVVGLAYSKIIELDAGRQIFGVALEIYTQWSDIRLAWKAKDYGVWNPADYGGIQYIWVNPEDVWIPENIVGNAKVLDEIYNEDYLSLKLWFNGTLVLARSYYAELSCPIDVGHFPFDRQKCQVVTMAVSYDRNQVFAAPMVNNDFDATHTSNGEWSCKDIESGIEVWGGSNFKFDVVTFTFTFQRVPHFYIYVIVLPCLILTTLSIIGMFWRPNEQEEQLAKLGIGLTSLVSMTVLMDIVSGAIPKTIKFPLLGLYVVISIAIIAVACVIVVVFPRNGQCPFKDMDKTQSIRLRMFTFFSSHVVCHAIFQILNVASFAVFMSYWKS